MESDAIVENLAYLSKYLEESRTRVGELERELDSTRRATSEKKEDVGAQTRIKQLEGERDALRKEVSSLQDRLKVKQEGRPVKLEPKADSALLDVKPNADLADARKALVDERRLRVEWQEKHANLEAQVKGSAELASSALRQRIEGDKALEDMRREAEVMRGQIQTLKQEANDKLKEDDREKTEAMASLRAKYDALKEAKRTWRASSDELRAKISSLEDELVEVTAEREALRTETEELKETLREMIEVVENLPAEAKDGEPDVVEDLSVKYREADRARTELQQKCVSLELRLAQETERVTQLIIEREAARSVNAQKKYRAFMQELPAPVSSPPYTPPSTKQLEPICFITTNLHGYLSEDAASKSVLNHALYLPKRLWHMFGFQYVAYGPTHRYDRIAGNWTEGSDLTSFHGGTRELFVDAKEFMVYIGTYRCHDLGPLEPNGTSLPSHISLPEIMDAALGVPWPPGHATIMKQRYPDGVRVSATGLQCVGFNMQLYDALRKRFAHERNKVNADGRKRKAEEEDAPLGGKGKSQKRS